MSYLKILREAIDAYLSFVILDTETTGLYNAEICQIAIIDHQANTLIDTLVRTQNPIPPKATAIHGITDEMVAAAPDWLAVRKQVLEIIDSKLVLVYNVVFDRHMMHSSDRAVGLEEFSYKTHANFVCVMEAYAEYAGDWSEYHKSYTWKTLTVATQRFGFTIDEAHTALADCHVTLA